MEVVAQCGGRHRMFVGDRLEVKSKGLAAKWGSRYDGSRTRESMVLHVATGCSKTFRLKLGKLKPHGKMWIPSHLPMGSQIVSGGGR